MLDAELRGDPDLLSHGAKRHQTLFVIRAMLAVHRHKTVGVATQDVFQPAALDMHGDRHANNNVSPVYPLLQRRLLGHDLPPVSLWIVMRLDYPERVAPRHCTGSGPKAGGGTRRFDAAS